jgi:hypothetical protein
MAEFVQREIEEMLQEMECLRKSNIFTTDETRLGTLNYENLFIKT